MHDILNVTVEKPDTNKLAALGVTILIKAILHNL